MRSNYNSYNEVVYDTFSTDTESGLVRIEEINYNKGGNANVFSSGFNMANSAIGGNKSFILRSFVKI